MRPFPELRRLFILAEPRSGSSWLRETLNSHPDIRLEEERLNHVQFPEIRAFLSGGEPGFRACLAHLERVLARRSDRAAWSGCKVLLNQLDFIGPGFADRFLDRYREASFILLVRGNLVSEHISLRLAHRYASWHARRRNQVVLKRVALPPEVLVADMERSLRRRQAIQQGLRERRARCCELSYEGLFADMPGTLAAIMRFLGLEPTRLTPSGEMKGNPFPPREVIENFQEVREHLRRYPEFLRMLDDAGTWLG
jgi:LPS sulfotransferase NodH